VARTIKDTSLDTRAARGRLMPRGKPYYRKIEEGLHLGYRKPRGRKGKPAVSGKWVLRRYVGGQAYVVETIGIADDFDDADGHAILNFSQAQAKARGIFKQGARDEAGITGPLTIAEAVRDYLENLEHRGKSSYDARCRANAFIIPALGNIEVSKLTSKRLYDWLKALASTPPRLRTKKDHEQRHGELDQNDKEAVRKRKASANKTLTYLKAALTLAFRQNKVSSDAAWRQVKPYERVEAAKLQFLNVAEAQRLINACDPEFRPMVEAALASGCRYGELCALDVNDFDPDHETLSIRQSKSGKARKVYLTGEGARLFKRLAAGRTGIEPLLRDNSGQRFTKSRQDRPMRDACARAKIKPAIGFHGLRHTYASLLVKSGVPMRYVAEALGHASTTMTEKHYAHLAPSHVADTIRKHAPQFGFTTRSNVARLR
jgi:integrase